MVSLKRGDVMDLLLVVMAIEIIVIIVGIVGIIIARRELKNFIRNLWPDESIAVFGIKNVGKSTLIRLLKGETLPLQHVDTYGALPVGRVVYDLTGDETYFFRSREMYDVGGEHVGQWKVIIKKQNPDGIIFIVDTKDPKKRRKGLERFTTSTGNWPKRPSFLTSGCGGYSCLSIRRIYGEQHRSPGKIWLNATGTRCSVKPATCSGKISGRLR